MTEQEEIEILIKNNKLIARHTSGTIMQFDIINVDEVNCAKQGLYEILFVPDLVKKINCSGNHIRILPELPYVKILHCRNNLLTELPKLESIISLDCSDNKLTELPSMPYLTGLSASNNLFEHEMKIQDCKIQNIDNIQILEF